MVETQWLTCINGKIKARAKLNVQLKPHPMAEALGLADCRKNSVFRIHGTGPKNSCKTIFNNVSMRLSITFSRKQNAG